MVTIEINGKKIQAKPGSMLIEVADAVGIYIPRFCYHKKLSIAANCRMCLVEVEKSPKALPACATPVAEGMKILTKSNKTREAQKGVMEFLLVNHPLDCPICDQGGECELQDLSMGFGRAVSLYNETKRAVHDQNFGPLIATDMTRCIYCTRCVRFSQEIAGVDEIGLINRGEHAEISTYVQHSLTSEMSGNIIDLCPVGALTSKPFRFKARPWELTQHKSIAPHDCIGSSILVHTRRGQVMRVLPQENETINETWLSDRDRFSYTGLYQYRVTKPLIKQDDHWEEAEWSVVFDYIAKALSHVIEQFGVEQIGALVSASATLEEYYVLQKLLRQLGSDNIDYRIRQTDFADQACTSAFPDMELDVQAIEKQDNVLLVGSIIQREQPIASHKIRQATVNHGVKVFCINPLDYPFNFKVTDKMITHPLQMPHTLAAIAKALIIQTKMELPSAIKKQLDAIEPTSAEMQLAKQFNQGEKKTIFLGALALEHPQAATIKALAQLIAKLSGATFNVLTSGSNSAGAFLAGAVPHRSPNKTVGNTGLTAATMLRQPLKAYFLYDIDPVLDCADPSLAKHALDTAQFVIAFSAFKTENLAKYANVILPIAPFTENCGTFINCEGKWQSFDAAAKPLGVARPGWQVLRVFAKAMQLAGFDYADVASVRSELKAALDTVASLPSSGTIAEIWPGPYKLGAKLPKLTRIAYWPLYRSDLLVRQAQPLQACAAHEALTARIHPLTQEKLKLKTGEKILVTQENDAVTLPLVADAIVPQDCVLVANGYSEVANLGGGCEAIMLKAAEK